MMKFKQVFCICIALSLVLMLTYIPATTAEESPVGIYNFGGANGTFEGDTKELILTTNGVDIWNESDDGTFYCTGVFDFLYGDCSMIELTATINSQILTKGAGDGGGAFGIVMRGGLEPDDPNVFLRVGQDGSMLVTSRNGKYVRTGYKNAGKVTLPQAIRLVRIGNTFSAQKLEKDGQWVTTATVECVMGEKVYVGVAGFSHVNDSYIQAHFTDITTDTSASYDPDFFGEYIETEVLSKNVLLKEKFNDGSLNGGIQSAINPIWSNAPKYYLSERDETGNVWFWRRGAIGSMTAGDMWADYEVSADVRFKGKYITGNGGIFKLRARCMPNFWYGESHYEFAMIDGTKLQLTKGRWNKSKITYKILAETEIPNFLDNISRNVTLRVIDNVIEGYIDGKLMLRAEDDIMPLPKGKIGFYTEEADILIDNIVVSEINDGYGGTMDNELMNGWNRPSSFFERLNQVHQQY